MSGAVAELMRDVEDLGFTLVRRTKHSWLYRDRAGNSLGIPTSPSDFRSLANCRADLRRIVNDRTNAPLTEEPTMNAPATSIPAPSVVTTTAMGIATRTCIKCNETKPLEDFQLSWLPTVPAGTRMKTCHPCRAAASGKSKSANAAKNRPVAAVEKPKTEKPAKVTTSVQGQAEARRAQRERWAGTPAREADKPEDMAMRVLVRRHQAEYDTLLDEMMVAIGWAS